MSQYPDEEVTLFVWRHFGSMSPRRELRFLDLGCGQGATTWFLAREGYSTTALDGSPSALRHTRGRAQREGLSAGLVQGDLTQLPLASASFHCAIDVMSICCNNWVGMLRGLEEARRVVVPGGLLFSRMPRATPRMEPFESLGDMSFMERQDIDRIFGHLFSRVSVGLTTRRSDDVHLEHWDIIAQK